MIHGAEPVPAAVVDSRALDFLGRDQAIGFTGLPGAGHRLVLHDTTCELRSSDFVCRRFGLPPALAMQLIALSYQSEHELSIARSRALLRRELRLPTSISANAVTDFRVSN